MGDPQRYDEELRGSTDLYGIELDRSRQIA